MFQDLQRLFDELAAVNQDFSKYKNARDARKLLQGIIMESRVLRKTINDERKNAKVK